MNDKLCPQDLLLIGEFCEQKGPTPLYLFFPSDNSNSSRNKSNTVNHIHELLPNSDPIRFSNQIGKENLKLTGSVFGDAMKCVVSTLLKGSSIDEDFNEVNIEMVRHTSQMPEFRRKIQKCNENNTEDLLWSSTGVTLNDAKNLIDLNRDLFAYQDSQMSRSNSNIVWCQQQSSSSASTNGLHDNSSKEKIGEKESELIISSTESTSLPRVKKPNGENEVKRESFLPNDSERQSKFESEAGIPEYKTLSYWKLLVTRILSSDHSNSQIFPYISLPSHLYLTYEGYDVYAMLLTFQDLYARGFSRPVCVCYISPISSCKILPHFQSLSTSFENVANVLHFGNSYRFLRDITKEMQRNVISCLDNKTKREIIDELKSLLKNYENFLNGSRICLKDDISTELFQLTRYEDLHLSHLPSDFLKLFQKGLGMLSENAIQFMPSVFDQLHKKKGFESKLRSIETICQTTFSTAMSMISDQILTFYSRNSQVLKLERDDSKLIEDKPLPSLLFTGKNLIMDFDLDACLLKRKPKHRLLTPHFNRSNSIGGLLSISSSSSAHGSANSSLEQSSPPINETQSEESDTYSDILDSSIPERDMHGFNSNSSTHSGSDSHPIFLSKRLLMNYRSEKLSIFWGRNTGSFVNTVYPESYVSQNASRIFTFQQDHLDEYCTLHDFVIYYQNISIHLIYNLLIGRPTVLVAPNEMKKLASRIAQCLSVFVPGQYWNNYARTQEMKLFSHLDRNISLKDLQTLKIMSVPKTSCIPTQFRGTVTVLDLEKDCLFAVKYEGSFLLPIVAMAPLLPNNQSFLANVYAILLEIAKQATLHMHTNVLPTSSSQNPINSREYSGSLLSVFSRKSERDLKGSQRAKILQKYFPRISKCDNNILDYFTRVIMKQQMQSFMNNLIPTPIRLSQDQTTLFMKNSNPRTK